jgi:hypothetical protein
MLADLALILFLIVLDLGSPVILMDCADGGPIIKSFTASPVTTHTAER